MTEQLRQAAMQQALEALEGELLKMLDKPVDEQYRVRYAYLLRVITALREALAQPVQPEQEPTPWRDMMVVTLVREGINKHKARELADHFAAQQQVEPDAYGYASRFAVAMWEQHYKDVAPQWKPLDNLMGVLTQIDNMTSGLTRLEQPVQEPVGWVAEVELGAAKRSNKESFMVELWKKRLYVSDIALYGIKETT